MAFVRMKYKTKFGTRMMRLQHCDIHEWNSFESQYCDLMSSWMRLHYLCAVITFLARKIFFFNFFSLMHLISSTFLLLQFFHICYCSEDYSVTDGHSATQMDGHSDGRTWWIIEDLLILKIKINQNRIQI